MDVYVINNIKIQKIKKIGFRYKMYTSKYKHICISGIIRYKMYYYIKCGMFECIYKIH